MSYYFENTDDYLKHESEIFSLTIHERHFAESPLILHA